MNNIVKSRKKMIRINEDMKNDNYNEKYFMVSKRAQKMVDLEKERVERYRSQFPRRGVSVSYQTDFEISNLKVGDKIKISTLFRGKSDFTVVSISNEGIATLENGDIQTRLIWQRAGVWRNAHCTWNKNMKVFVTTV